MDIYKETAADMFNISVDEVTPEQRAEAKRRLCLSMYSVGNAAMPKHIEDKLVQELLTKLKGE